MTKYFNLWWNQIIQAVLVHNPSTCEVISFKDEIEKKSNQLNEADDLICLVDGSINHLND